MIEGVLEERIARYAPRDPVEQESVLSELLRNAIAQTGP